MKWNCSSAKEIDLIDYLASLGHEPIKVRGHKFWYLSPFRNEHTPSFKVNRTINRWYDFGEGKGGSIIDFGIRYFHCTIAEFLCLLSNQSVITVPLLGNVQPIYESGIKVKNIRPIFSYSLKNYLLKRCIPLLLADNYLKEILYTNGGNLFYGLGFPNNKGGWEIRSEYFKGSSSPKYFSLYACSSNNIYVFEGFFNFLSFLQLFVPTSANQDSDYLILNSLAFVDHSLELLSTYNRVSLFLDNDPAGDLATAHIINCIPSAIDKRHLFKPYEDLNDYLTSSNCQINLPP